MKKTNGKSTNLEKVLESLLFDEKGIPKSFISNELTKKFVENTEKYLEKKVIFFNTEEIVQYYDYISRIFKNAKIHNLLPEEIFNFEKLSKILENLKNKAKKVDEYEIITSFIVSFKFFSSLIFLKYFYNVIDNYTFERIRKIIAGHICIIVYYLIIKDKESASDLAGNLKLFINKTISEISSNLN